MANPLQAIARSQFSIAVSCEGVQPAASGHRTLSAGGESVESVADPEGKLQAANFFQDATLKDLEHLLRDLTA